jgi:hypothetical protein
MVGRGQTDRVLLGGPCAAAASTGLAGWPVAGPPAGAQRHRVEAAHRSTVAGRAGALWPVADVRGAALPLAARRDVGSAAGPRADALGGRGGRGGLGGARRALTRPDAAACARGASSAPSRRRNTGIVQPADEGLGRRRGGLTTKCPLTCDGKGRPRSIVITAGQRHDSTQVVTVLSGIRVPHPAAGDGDGHAPVHRSGAGRPSRPPHCREGVQVCALSRVAAPAPDPAHDAAPPRPARPSRGTTGTSAGLRPNDLRAARRRGARRINRLQPWRGLATRYEKRTVNYRAMVVLASIVLWLES